MSQNLKYIFVVVAFAIGIVMLMDFATRVTEAGRLKYKRDQVAQEGTRLQMTQIYLVTRVAYASSDAAALEFAYNEERLQRPGDVRVVPLPMPNETPLPTATPVQIQKEYRNWDYWRTLIFGPES